MFTSLYIYISLPSRRGLLKTPDPNPILGLLQCSLSSNSKHYCGPIPASRNVKECSFGLNLVSSCGFQGLACSSAKCTDAQVHV